MSNEQAEAQVQARPAPPPYTINGQNVAAMSTPDIMGLMVAVMEAITQKNGELATTQAQLQQNAAILEVLKYEANRRQLNG